MEKELIHKTIIVVFLFAEQIFLGSMFVWVNCEAYLLTRKNGDYVVFSNPGLIS
jgi:hypothetical protein